MRIDPLHTTGTTRQRIAPTVLCEWPGKVDEVMQAELADLMNRVLLRETTIGFPGPLPRAEALALMKQTAEAVARGAKHLLIFRTPDQKIIGHVLFAQNYLPNCRHIGEVSRVFIDPEHRGVHIITLGLGEVVEKADALGIEIIQLDVRAHTPIHRLWQGLGFVAIGIMKDYARVNGQSFDGCFMYQRVTELRRRWSARVG